MAALSLVYINHSPEPTTFLVKLVGLSLFTMLAVLGLVSLIVYPRAELIRENGVLPPQRQSLRFEPEGAQRYRVDSVAFHFDPDLGAMLDGVDAAGTAVALGFSFPFYDQQWSEVTVSSDALVGFGGLLHPRADIYFYDEQPKIAPLRMPLAR